MEPVVRIVKDGETLAVFRIDIDPPLAFWRVEIPGRDPYHAPIRVTGKERPAFFYRLLAAAMEAR